MKTKPEALMRDLYNLIINPATRDWERHLLVQAKNNRQQLSPTGQLKQLEADLRPLAMRNNLTPDVMDFYLAITGNAPMPTKNNVSAYPPLSSSYEERAVFAGGCFWCMVEPFDQRPGINNVISGYTGGSWAQPTYEQVSGQYTGHVEAVEIRYDSRKISYQNLVDIYWQLIDPTDRFGQINDRGSQYRPVIFYANQHQLTIAQASKQALVDSQRYQKPIVVAIEPLQQFWPAENYHQDFYRKQPRRYRQLKKAHDHYLNWLKFKNKF
ncbi:peptide-methionine (S)-S-oxide reductase MsrA [Lactiplantibacillus plantarum]|uniref:peptide-methionine (S)-S-oxide reductase MsrA n=1 Tax=Lactiplantibacillus plantarum TaxID=1590 RepID=UPI003F8665AF